MSDQKPKKRDRILSYVGLMTVARHEAIFDKERRRLANRYVTLLNEQNKKQQEKKKLPVSPSLTKHLAQPEEKEEERLCIVGKDGLPICDKAIASFKRKVIEINERELAKPPHERDLIHFDEAQEQVLFCKAPAANKVLSIHGSKGLEANSVFIIGDIEDSSAYPIREALYHLADMPMSYKKAQNEEARRLAYVAITRARTRCFWFYTNVDRNKCAAQLNDVAGSGFIPFGEEIPA